MTHLGNMFCDIASTYVTGFTCISNVDVTFPSDLTLSLGVHLVSASILVVGGCTRAVTYVHKTAAFWGKDLARNRNIAAILLSFHGLLIIPLAHSVCARLDKSAAQ